LIVRTTSGRVEGRDGGGLTICRGIPFAAPPVGAARFAAPQPPEPWEGVRDAAEFGPPAPQEGAEPAGDEWLTVNVWTPDPDPAARRPVLVWIHGGAYVSGASNRPIYDPGNLVRQGDVVVVTLNYRLGVEGFAVLEGAPANRGLLDQIAALRWVHENIASFGGDPEQVTVFGESAGGGSVAALLAMPAARGLFRRAIAQSVPGTYFGLELAAGVGAAIATELGRRPSVEDLTSVAPGDLVAAAASVQTKQPAYAWGTLAHHDTLFAPVVDGESLPSTPWAALKAGAAREVDLIAGHNRDEWRMMLALGDRAGPIGDDDVEHALRWFGMGRDYRAAYPAASAEDLLVTIHSDWLFRMPSYQLAEAQAAGGGRAFLYELTFGVPLLGACHALDLPLLFGHFDVDLGARLLAGADRAGASSVGDAMRRAWTAFARTGDPGWPAFDPATRPTRIFDVDGGVGRYPEEISRRLWAGYEFPVMSSTSTG